MLDKLSFRYVKKNFELTNITDFYAFCIQDVSLSVATSRLENLGSCEKRMIQINIKDEIDIKQLLNS